MERRVRTSKKEVEDMMIYVIYNDMKKVGVCEDNARDIVKI